MTRREWPWEPDCEFHITVNGEEMLEKVEVQHLARNVFYCWVPLLSSNYEEGTPITNILHPKAFSDKPIRVEEPDNSGSYHRDSARQMYHHLMNWEGMRSDTEQTLAYRRHIATPFCTKNFPKPREKLSPALRMLPMCHKSTRQHLARMEPQDEISPMLQIESSSPSYHISQIEPRNTFQTRYDTNLPKYVEYWQDTKRNGSAEESSGNWSQ